MIKRATQRIRYVSTGDGVQLAWAEAGKGFSFDQGRELVNPP